MGDVVSIETRRRAVIRYENGDITAALRMALDHPEVADDIEEAFSELMFESDPECDSDSARELLFWILEAAHQARKGGSS